MLKKLIAVGATVLVALGIVAVAALPAQAHNTAITATTACSTTTPNTSTITWTVSNDWDTPGTITQVVGSAAGKLTPDPQNKTVPVQKNGVNGTLSFTQTVTGKATFDLQVRMVWSDYATWSNDKKVTTSATCTVPVVPGSVTPTQAQCDAQHPGEKTNGSYLITGAEHVSYTASVNGQTAPVAAGVAIPVTVGGSPVTVTVTPKAAAGYALTAYDASAWTMTFVPVASDCLTHITVSAVPSVAPALCIAAGELGNGSIAFPALPTGAIWQYSSASTGPWAAAPASLSAAPGSTVYARISALPGYAIVSGTTAFTEVVPQGDASHCVTPTQPTATQSVCDAENPGKVVTASYTVPTTTGIDYQVDGTTVTGTVAVSVGSTPVTITVVAVARSGYAIPAGTTTSFPLTFAPKDGSDCVKAAVTAVPQFEDSACVPAQPGTKTGGDYILPDVTGVDYHVQVDGGPIQDGVAAGTYPATPGEVVLVTETPESGWELTDYPVGGYAHTFGADAGDCLTAVSPITPTTTAQTCTVDDAGHGSYVGGTIDIQVVEHVTYSIDGTVVDTTGKSAGAVVSTPEPTMIAHTVTAVADAGYKLSGYPTGGWSYTLQPAEACGDLVTHPVVDPAVASTQAGCFAAGTYTLSSDLDSYDPKAVAWTVDGSPVDAGTYTVPSGAHTVTIHAAPASGYGFASGTQTEWTLQFAAAAGCDLATLAVTGTANPTGWIGLGSLLVMLGAGLVAAPLVLRRRRRAHRA